MPVTNAPQYVSLHFLWPKHKAVPILSAPTQKTKPTDEGKMSRKLVVGFDGSDASLRALDFAITRAQTQGDSLLIAHVLEWSPYSFLTPSELEDRHRRRKEELQRAETSVMGPVMKRMEIANIPFETTMRYGHIAETLCRVAKEEVAAMIFIGRMGNSGFASRIFGSVAATLAQVAPVPVVIVP